MSVVHRHSKIKAATFSYVYFMYIYVYHMHCMHIQWPQSASKKDDFSVVKCYTILQFCCEIYFEKKSHRKWYCFTMWLQGGTSKSGKRRKTTTGKSDPRCQLRDIPTGPECFLGIFGDFRSQKQVLTNFTTCDVKACPLFMTLTSSGGSC